MPGWTGMLTAQVRCWQGAEPFIQCVISGIWGWGVTQDD